MLAFLASSSDFGISATLRSSTRNRPEKSTRPSRRPMGGMITPSTRVVTILPKAAPMMTPTARSITFPRAMKSRNSLSIGGGQGSGFGGQAPAVNALAETATHLQYPDFGWAEVA